ncbi:MAG: hypothetical protein R3195_03350 [Gemmatimonadota bacterium]|nr:hypothetical protein [Gemmatimonadota bacterium]
MTRTRIARTLASGVVVLTAACNEPFRPPAGFESPSPGDVLDLAVGERLTVNAGDVPGGFELRGVPESRSYLFIVHDSRSSAGGTNQVRFHTSRIPTSLSTAPSPGDAARRVGRSVGSGDPDDPFAGWYDGGEDRFRSGVRRDLTARGVRAAGRGGAGGPAVRASVASSVPVSGELIDFGSPVEIDGSLATCTSSTRVTGRVRAVGERFAIVEDTLVTGYLSDADFAELLDEIETVAWPVDSTYFGTPQDIDGNGRVIAFMTGEVNRLGAAGFFTSSDLAVADDCPTSNEGEVLWLLAPDPARMHGFDPIPTDLIRQRIAGVVAHELQHLIHLQRRVYEAGGDLDSADLPWMNEGLSHIAEEVAGFYVAGRRTGQNYALEDMADSEVRTRFARYHLNDFRFMREYFEDTAGVPVLIDGPVTRGELQKARGFGYLFLRWLADRYATGGPQGIVASTAEESFFRDLTIGGAGLRQSVENILGALAAIGVSVTWEELFGEYVANPPLDDALDPAFGLDDVYGIPSWNLPAAYEAAADNGFELDFPNGFPLRPKLILLPTIPVAGFDEDFDLDPSTAAYFRLEAAFETPLTRVHVTRPDGLPFAPGSGIRVTVVRTL